MSLTSPKTLGAVRSARTNPAPTQGGALEHITPLPIHSEARTPTAGQQAIAASYPMAGRGRLIASTGVYLGRVRWKASELPYRLWDLVGIHPQRAREDACNFGGSGSTALLADGTVLGALGQRTTYGYPHGIAMQEKDSPSAFGWLSSVIQRQLRLDISLAEFTTICAYSVPPAGIEGEIEAVRTAQTLEGSPPQTQTISGPALALSLAR